MTMILPSRRPAASLFARVAETVADVAWAAGRTVARRIAAEVDRRRTMELLSYDARLLSDIGVTRGDVIGALLTAPGEKPSEHLANERETRRAAERAQAREAARETGRRDVRRVA